MYVHETGSSLKVVPSYNQPICITEDEGINHRPRISSVASLPEIFVWLGQMFCKIDNSSCSSSCIMHHVQQFSGA